MWSHRSWNDSSSQNEKSKETKVSNHQQIKTDKIGDGLAYNCFNRGDETPFHRAIKNNNEEKISVNDDPMILKVKNEFSLIEIKRVVLLSLTILISILLFTYVDVLISSIILILGCCLVCGLRKIWIILSLSIGLISLAYFLLYHVLGTAVG